MRLKLAKARSAETPTPLAPEAQARLESQVAGVAAALEAGADLAALPEQVIPDPQDPNWDVHLMAALGSLNYPAIPPLLAALFGAARDKARHKALRKTLHRLKTRGVAVPDDLLPREAASPGTPSPGPVAVFVSPVFRDGNRYVILEGPRQILGGNLLACRVNDGEGFKEFVLLNLTRRDKEEFWEEYRHHGLTDWVSPPPAYAVRLLEEAYTGHPNAGGETAEYAILREKIFRYWGHPENAPSPERELAAIPTGEQRRLLDQSGKLASDPLFHDWLPDGEEIAPWIEKLGQIQDSPLVLFEHQQQARVDVVVNEAIQALFPPESRPDWRRRLQAMADYLYFQGRAADARALWVAAADLVDMEKGILAGENPFLLGLMKYALHLEWEDLKEAEPETESVLVDLYGEPLPIRR